MGVRRDSCWGGDLGMHCPPWTSFPVCDPNKPSYTTVSTLPERRVFSVAPGGQRAGVGLTGLQLHGGYMDISPSVFTTSL